MKIAHQKTAFLLSGCAALTIILMVQYRALRAARLELAELLITASRPAPAALAAVRIPERTELGRLRNEQDELLRLRAKRDEMDRKEAAFRATVVPPPPPLPLEGVVKPLAATLTLARPPVADRSTPVGTLHEWIWATKQADATSLAALRPPGMPPAGDDGSDLDPASPLHELIRYTQAAARLRNKDDLEGVASVNLTQQREVAEDRIVLTFGFEAGEGRAKGLPSGGEASLRKVADQWYVESWEPASTSVSIQP